jgi:tRNA-uridine 2-sulfurtransferase
VPICKIPAERRRLTSQAVRARHVRVPSASPSSPARTLVALSGGVDSSVAALLLRDAGVPVEAAYMKNWINEDNILGDCPWEQDIADARRVADQLGIPFRVVNLMEEYREKVVAYLLDGYTRGLTPNPDVMCNREIKFGVLRQWALDHGFAAVATGHYARREPLPGRPEDFALLEGADSNKDQSYFLAMLSQEQLRDARFPVGELLKPELRALARRAGLATAEKKDSQGICFIGQVKMADFLRAYVPDAPGPIVRAEDGRLLGEHRGLHFFTLGQRKGIGVPSNTDGKAYVVVGKRAADRALLVAFDAAEAPGLFTREALVHGLRWNTPTPPSPGSGPLALEGRVRYRDPRVRLTFELTTADTARVVFAEPQRGLASGQILALHDGPRLLGGGVYL